MKVARTYVFLLVPILIDRLAHTTVPNGFCTGSNGHVLPNQKYDEKPLWRMRDRKECETEVLPDDLSWTWFVDNPRPRFHS